MNQEAMQVEIEELKRRVQTHDDLLPKIYDAINASNLTNTRMNALLEELRENRCKTPNVCPELIANMKDLDKRIRFLEGLVKWAVGICGTVTVIVVCGWELVKFYFKK